MSSKQPIVIIGGGHNGLTAAAYLAKAGRSVVLCEARSKLGGIAATEEFHPGYYNTGLWHRSSRVRPSVVRDLSLPAHGFSFEKQDAPIYVPQADGPGLVLHRDPEQARAELSMHSATEAESYRAWREKLTALAPIVDEYLERSPNASNAGGRSGLFEFLRTSLSWVMSGERQLAEIRRILSLSAADWLNEHFETEILKSALVTPGLLGNWCGPRSSETAALTLLTECTTGHEVKAGPAALIGCLERAARHHGADLRIESPVARIEVERGGVQAVLLESGESIPTNTVLTACDPKRALLGLLEPGTLDVELTHRMKEYRMRGTTAKVHLALDALPNSLGRPDSVFERIQTGENLDEIEEAFAPVKSGSIPSNPQLDIRFPSITDPVLAPPGKHVASILVHFVPYQHEQGWGAKQRDELERVVMHKLRTVMPTIEDSILGSETLTPQDLEDRYRLTGGHVFHGEHAVDQFLFKRPDPSCSRYSTPIRGLYLAGSGSHPGGGITCGPGALAARAVLRSS